MKKIIFLAISMLYLPNLTQSNDDISQNNLHNSVNFQQKNLKQIMKKMGKYFNQIQESQDILKMQAQTRALLTYAKQAQNINLNKAQFKKGIKNLTQLIAKLLEAIEQKDQAKALNLVKEIDKTRKFYHQQLRHHK